MRGDLTGLRKNICIWLDIYLPHYEFSIDFFTYVSNLVLPSIRVGENIHIESYDY